MADSPGARGAEVSINRYLLPSEAWEGPVPEEGVRPLPSDQSKSSLVSCNQKQLPDSKLQSDGATGGAGVGAGVGGDGVGGGVGPKKNSTLSNKFGDGDPDPKFPLGFVTLPDRAVASNLVSTSDTVGIVCPLRENSSEEIIAAAPETCGQAIEVPEIDFVSVSLFFHADRMWLPGANRSRQGPTLLKPDLLSSAAVEPTVMALGTCAGLDPHAFQSGPELPAATTTITPAATALLTASL